MRARRCEHTGNGWSTSIASHMVPVVTYDQLLQSSPGGGSELDADVANLNNTWGHYQDNRVQWFLDDATGAHLTALRDAGVVALMFGGGAAGVTRACDDIGDGVTNPAPIGGNTTTSQLATAGSSPAFTTIGGVPTLVTPYAADDDGGYFKWRVWAYYQAGAVPLATPPKPPANVHIVR